MSERYYINKLFFSATFLLHFLQAFFLSAESDSISQIIYQSFTMWINMYTCSCSRRSDIMLLFGAWKFRVCVWCTIFFYSGWTYLQSFVPFAVKTNIVPLLRVSRSVLTRVHLTFSSHPLFFLCALSVVKRHETQLNGQEFVKATKLLIDSIEKDCGAKSQRGIFAQIFTDWTYRVGMKKRCDMRRKNGFVWKINSSVLTKPSLPFLFFFFFRFFLAQLSCTHYFM